MKRLIIDITELVTWQGKLTGVPRVMNELHMRFKNNNNAVFVFWDSSTKGYIETDYPNNENNDNQESSIKKTLLKSQYINLLIPTYNRILVKSAQTFRGKNISSLNEKKFNFSKGDTLLIMADWHGSDGNFVDYLQSIHESGVSLVQMVYDLIPLVTPQYSGHSTTYLANYAEKVYPICSKLVAISKNTKRDIVKVLESKKIKIPPIEVIRLGDDFSYAIPIKPKEEIFADSKINRGDFILCVGTIEARKNHTLLYYVYKLANSRKIKIPKLVIVGRLGWQSENIYEFINNDPDVKNKILIMQNVDDNELSWLYQNCLFSIYPSFYEGWGLPIAESISRGVPCLSSDTSSMPEIAGSLARYFSPYSPDDCLEVISKMQDRKNLNKVRTDLKKYVPYSWQDTFNSLIGFINE
jgi:hypothetical protein